MFQVEKRVLKQFWHAVTRRDFLNETEPRDMKNHVSRRLETRHMSRLRHCLQETWTIILL